VILAPYGFNLAYGTQCAVRQKVLFHVKKTLEEDHCVPKMSQSVVNAIKRTHVDLKNRLREGCFGPFKKFQVFVPM
jgi:hypothetical protein